MGKVLIKVSTPKGPTYRLLSEAAIREVREFCSEVGYEWKIIGTRKR